ncbi:hypothetical protein N7537_004760 [Penicillium hordei]|uniref:Uncharacterized protein n=1 Tax=Penicillium hordei TaxID=40994 RepID=A0AAD6H564_9EURO|nr:uncharacterized protein N7537_004760 [Penicillium hordei]KAJ5608141.1 hypothetical protein N7537_004760 [Penicillium hordei]
MPITLTTAKHLPHAWKFPRAAEVEELFEQSYPKELIGSKRLIGKSFTKDLFDTSHTSASKNGFAWAGFYAYSHHRNRAPIRRCVVHYSDTAQLLRYCTFRGTATSIRLA